MTDAQIIANFDAAQAEHIAASKAYATRNVGSMELLVLAETRRRDPELAMQIASQSADQYVRGPMTELETARFIKTGARPEQTPTIKTDEAQNG